MSAIGPGDFVEAVLDFPEDGVMRGRIYTVLDMVPARLCTECCSCGKAGEGFTLKQTPEANRMGCWCYCGFKPVYRPKPDAFADLLKTPTDVREPEHA